MGNIKTIIFSIASSFIAILGIFFYGIKKGKSQKESQIIKKGIDDAIQTKAREDIRRNDDINDVVERMRKYSSK